MKKVESLRQAEGNGIIVRLFDSTLMDKRWLPLNFNVKNKKKYLLVRYSKNLDVNLLDVPKSKSVAKRLRIQVSKEEIKQKRLNVRKGVNFRKWFNDFLKADEEYVKWTKKYCGSVEKSFIEEILECEVKNL